MGNECCLCRNNRIENNAENNKHIMISYSWNYKPEIAETVHNYLSDAGYNVWMDRFGGITTNCNSDIAAGVENASVIMLWIKISTSLIFTHD